MEITSLHNQNVVREIWLEAWLDTGAQMASPKLCFSSSLGKEMGLMGEMMNISSPRIVFLEFTKPSVKRVFLPTALVEVACPFLNQALWPETWLFWPRSTTHTFDRGSGQFSPLYYDTEWFSLPVTYTQGIYYISIKRRIWILGKQNYIHHP